MIAWISWAAAGVIGLCALGAALTGLRGHLRRFDRTARDARADLVARVAALEVARVRGRRWPTRETRPRATADPTNGRHHSRGATGASSAAPPETTPDPVTVRTIRVTSDK